MLCNTFYLNSKEETIVNENKIEDLFLSIYSTVASNIQASLLQCSGWITNSVINHTFNTLKCNPLASCSYIKLTKVLGDPRKGLINIQIIDGNVCSKWSFSLRFPKLSNLDFSRSETQ